jgi:hypothetical protein
MVAFAAKMTQVGDPKSMLAVVATGVAIIGFCSIPAASSLVLNLTKKEKKDDGIYEDGDGKATPESVKAFSNFWPKTLIFLCALAGVPLSLVIPIISTGVVRAPVEDWTSAAAWVRFPQLK